METSHGLDVTKLSVQKAYDTIAEKYLAYVQQSPDVRPDYIEQLFSLLVEPSFPIRALELGCGPGVPGTQILAKRCQQVTAIDLSEKQLRLARFHVTGDNVTFLHSDMAALRFGPNSFEVVAALYSLYHLSLEDQRAIVGSVFEWLSVGGILLCALQPTQCTAGKNEFLGAHTYYSSFGSEGNRQVLREAGFDIVKDLIEVEGGDDRFMNHWIWARKSKS